MFCSILQTRAIKYTATWQAKLNKSELPKRNSEVRTFPHAVDLDDPRMFETLRNALDKVCVLALNLRGHMDMALGENRTNNIHDYF